MLENFEIKVINKDKLETILFLILLIILQFQIEDYF